MICGMKHSLRSSLALVTLLAVVASPARGDEEEIGDKPDARLMGYTAVPGSKSGTAVLETSASTALTYIMFFMLAGLCVGVMFKNPKRSHLD